MTLTRDERVARAVRIGELAVSGAAAEAFADVVDIEKFRFHGPDGAESDHAGLVAYFATLRAAFDDLTLTRGIMLADGDYMAYQTRFEGTFAREFTASPVGPLPPNGRHLGWDVINIVRLDDQGRVVEEWVQYDNRSFLRALGAGER
ncbi:ester cyclase [Amycolatopsis sp. GM8]|uniref:ester cyclase n=1 Tax=Amycolatopsis sp. GM8 TaxID=2896530 RepID=UPI001F1AED5C|nr:ester cyclase [Amycolatopsis sp. GM8]